MLRCDCCNQKNDTVKTKGDLCDYCRALDTDERVELYTMTHSKLEGNNDAKKE